MTPITGYCRSCTAVCNMTTKSYVVLLPLMRSFRCLRCSALSPLHLTRSPSPVCPGRWLSTVTPKSTTRPARRRSTGAVVTPCEWSDRTNWENIRNTRPTRDSGEDNRSNQGCSLVGPPSRGGERGSTTLRHRSAPSGETRRGSKTVQRRPLRVASGGLAGPPVSSRLNSTDFIGSSRARAALCPVGGTRPALAARAGPAE